VQWAFDVLGFVGPSFDRESMKTDRVENVAVDDVVESTGAERRVDRHHPAANCRPTCVMKLTTHANSH